MYRLFLFYAAVLLASGVSCKKNPATAENSSLLVDGPLSASLGKMVNPKYRYYKFYGNQWGRDGNELFVSSFKGLLRFDLLRGTAEVLETSQGIMTGKTNENSAAIFIGTINGQHGYYAYDFLTNSTKKIMSLSPSDQATSLAIAGNIAFFYTGTTLGPPTNPCTSIWDIWCSNSSSISSEALYYINRNTNQITKLNWDFVCFSKDGSKAILREEYSERIYIVDANTLALLDVYDAPVTGGSLYFDEVVRYCAYDFTDLIIRNEKTNDEINRYRLDYRIADLTNIAWSKDGSKIYYHGYNAREGNGVIAIVDLATKEQKTIVSLPPSPNYDNISEFLLSDDNKKLLIRYENDLYIKDVN